MWADVSTRFPIDERRVYTTGFSGGARVASFFPRVIGRPIAGVVGCGSRACLRRRAGRSSGRRLLRPGGPCGFQLRRDEGPRPGLRPVRRPASVPLLRGLP
ncbi:MAG: hypothetical protein MZV64_11280 [Ignavibacteriales bacterium]|nr:hypothetical protein [Ignavibacteriales bacterium]